MYDRSHTVCSTLEFFTNGNWYVTWVANIDSVIHDGYAMIE